MRTELVGVLVLGGGLAVSSCGNDDRASHSGGTGGSVIAMGGSVGDGGDVGTGGLGGLTGGSGGPADGSGGSTGSGGTTASGGLTGSGGLTAGNGGEIATGGLSTTGGTSGDNTGGDITGGRGGDIAGGIGGDIASGSGGDIAGGAGGDIAGGTGGDIAGGAGGVPNTIGPCDIYAADGAPCVAAYSMVRRLSSTYAGPLYQVRSDSFAQNTGSGGTTHDIGMTADGFADGTAHEAACNGTTCTVSVLYDQSGHGNDLLAAKRARVEATGIPEHSYEAMADAAPLTVGGHEVHSLHTEEHEGYASPRGIVGDGLPLRDEPQGIYMLADGTQAGTGCCWDFGGASLDPTRYTVYAALFFGTAYWGEGAGAGPWFGADFDSGIWMGGTTEDDPGWGDLFTTAPPNLDNPSLAVPFALGFLKTDETNWALRMADLQTATSITTAYEGGLPKAIYSEGAIVLGLGTDSTHNSRGTFFEGAIVAGWPSNDAEHAVMQSIQSAGYGQ